MFFDNIVNIDEFAQHIQSGRKLKTKRRIEMWPRNQLILNAWRRDWRRLKASDSGFQTTPIDDYKLASWPHFDWSLGF